MTVKLYAFTCGTVTGEFAHLMEGGEGDITVPIPGLSDRASQGKGAVRHRAAPRLPARPRCTTWPAVRGAFPYRLSAGGRSQCAARSGRTGIRQHRASQP